MLRRHFLTNVCSFALLPQFAFTKDLLNIQNKNILHVCEIEIAFPEGATLSDFYQQRNQCMDLDSFSKIQSYYLSKGYMLPPKRESGAAGIKLQYSFLNFSHYASFIRSINELNLIDDKGLENSGFKFIRRYHQQKLS